MPITNDRELQQALSDLSPKLRRTVGAELAAQVLPLCKDSRLTSALSVARAPEYSEEALNDAYRTAKSIAVQTYTACGRDADWALQAAHFAAAACAAALTPETITNSAWKAAMQARMAHNCAMIEEAHADTESHAQKQYQIAESLIQG